MAPIKLTITTQLYIKSKVFQRKPPHLTIFFNIVRLPVDRVHREKTMGKIFSPDEVRERKIPRMQSFADVVSYATDSFREAHAVCHAILLGSCVTSTYDFRSDVDGIYIYDSEGWIGVKQIVAEIVRFAKERHVPFAFAPVSLEFASTEFHSIGYGFYEHMKYAIRKGGVIKGDPVKALSLAHSSRETDLVSYLRQKIRSIDEGMDRRYVLEDEYAYLDRVLRTSVHVARRMILWSGVGLFPDDSKVSVGKIYPGVASDFSKNLFHDLQMLDLEYSEALKKQLEGGYNEGVYRASIKKLWDEAVPQTLAFVEENARIVLSAKSNRS